MFYVAKPCSVCRTGHVAFCRCSDNCRIALMCVDCESLWEDPADLSAVQAKYPPHIAHTGDTARWASQVEIELRGWMDFIDGELLSVPAEP